MQTDHLLEECNSLVIVRNDPSRLELRCWDYLMPTRYGGNSDLLPDIKFPSSYSVRVDLLLEFFMFTLE